MNNQINSETKQENIMNQSRFLILTIASNCIKNNKQFNFKKLFKILVKNSKGALEKRAKKLLIQDIKKKGIKVVSQLLYLFLFYVLLLIIHVVVTWITRATVTGQC